MLIPTQLLSAQIDVTAPIPLVAEVRVDTASVLQKFVPRTLFGTFLEPIGNSTYNGLWAEILENPSLESGLWAPVKVAEMLHRRPELRRASDLSLPFPWEPLDEHEGNRYEVRLGDAANSWQALRLFGLPNQPTGIRQRVYLPAHRTLEYTGSFYARHVSGPNDIFVSIRPRNSTNVLTAQTIHVSRTSWTKYEFKLTLPAGALHRLEPADFAVELDGDESVDLDQFSLVPADAVSGFDPDALALVREMHSPLVRFGGNFTSRPITGRMASAPTTSG